VKVEESYEIWGQPPSQDGPKRATAGRKRSATADASASRKRRRTSVQQHAESGSPTVLPEIEAEGETGETPAQPVKRGPGRPRKNPIRQQTPVEVKEPTKKITLRVPNSPASKEALRQIWARGDDAGPSAGSQASGHAGVVKGIIGDVASNPSTKAATSDNNTNARSGPGPASFFKRDVSKLPSPNKTRSEFTIRNVQEDVLDISEDETQFDTSNPKAETIAAYPLNGTTRFDAADLEVEGAPSKLETPTVGSNHADWLEQPGAAATIREAQRLATRSSVGAPPFISEHTQPVLKLSSSAIPPGPDFGRTGEMQDLVTSTFVQGQQKKSESAWQPLPEDSRAINELAAQMEQELSPEEKAKISVHMNKNMSTRMRETLAWNRVDPLFYHFRTRAAKEYSRRKSTVVSYEVGNNAATPSPIPEWGRVSNEYALRTPADPSSWPQSVVGIQPAQTLDERKPFSNKFSSVTQTPKVLRGGTSSFRESPFETQPWHADRGPLSFTHTTEKANHAKNADMRSPSPDPLARQSSLPVKALLPAHEQHDDSSSVVHKPILAMSNILNKVGRSESDVDRAVFQRKFVSVHPPPMNRQTPNIYFDRNPQGSSIGAHSFDPLVGMADHSDPRTFFTPNSTDWPHVLAALQPSIDHFRQLTDGAEPRQLPLDSGYEVAHTLLQAHLHSWFVINRPDYAHKNAIPKIFKLERWEGGIEHWKFASNNPVCPVLPHAHVLSLTF
jgi:hypothetical protein